jgi:hypothetical protein
MRIVRALLAAGALVTLLVAAPASPASGATVGATAFACTAACTATGTITSTAPVTSVYPFFRFECLDRGGVYQTSLEVRPSRVGTTTAGLYTYTWTATARSTYQCIGYAELTVFGANDNFTLDSRVAPFDTRI